MPVAHYDASIAYDQKVRRGLPGQVARVYNPITDLPIDNLLDLDGNPIAALVSNSQGFVEPFEIVDGPSHVKMSVGSLQYYILDLNLVGASAEATVTAAEAAERAANLVEAPADEVVATLARDPQTLTRQSMSAVFVDRGGLHIDPSALGGTPLPDASGVGEDSTAALQDAITKAKSLRSFVGRDVARRIKLAGWYKFSQDLHLDSYGIEIVGEGGESGLLGVNAGVVLGGTSALTMRQGLRDLRVRRITTAGQEHGTALLVEGGGMNTDKYPCRWYLDHVEVEAPIHPEGLNPAKSVALKMRGTFLATVTAAYCRNAYHGLVIERDVVTQNLAANAITFIGGEIQAVRKLGSIGKALGIAFYGMAWEGASESGMDIDESHGITIDGGYFEKNAAYDVRIGEAGDCWGIKINGGISSVGGFAGTPEGAVKRAIVLRRAKGVDISGMYFASYDIPPVHVNETTPGAVTGSAQNNHHSKGAVPVVEVTAGRDWASPLIQGLTIDGTALAGNAVATFRGRAGQQRLMQFQSGAANRWTFGADAVAEGGSNAGSNLIFNAFTDAGGFLGTAVTVYRSTRQLRAHAGCRVDEVLQHTGASAGFFGAAPVARPSVTGSRSDGSALASLLSALHSLGLIQNNTSA